MLCNIQTIKEGQWKFIRYNIPFFVSPFVMIFLLLNYRNRIKIEDMYCMEAEKERYKKATGKIEYKYTTIRNKDDDSFSVDCFIDYSIDGEGIRKNNQ